MGVGGGGAEEGCGRGRRGSALGLDCCWSLVALCFVSLLHSLSSFTFSVLSERLEKGNVNSSSA